MSCRYGRIFFLSSGTAVGGVPLSRRALYENQEETKYFLYSSVVWLPNLLFQEWEVAKGSNKQRNVLFRAASCVGSFWSRKTDGRGRERQTEAATEAKAWRGSNRNPYNSLLWRLRRPNDLASGIATRDTRCTAASSPRSDSRLFSRAVY